MGLFNLFNRKSKTAMTPQNDDSTSKVHTGVERNFTNSKGFRGYKRIGLSIYGDSICDRDIPKVVRDGDGEIGSLPILLKQTIGDSWEGFNVYVSNLKIGTFYRREDDERLESLYQALLHDHVDSVHVRVEDGNTVIFADKKGKLCTEQRAKSYLFVHLTDNPTNK